MVHGTRSLARWKSTVRASFVWPMALAAGAFLGTHGILASGSIISVKFSLLGTNAGNVQIARARLTPCRSAH